MHHPTDRISHTTTFVTPVVEHWLEREIAQWVGSTMNLLLESPVAEMGTAHGELLNKE